MKNKTDIRLNETEEERTNRLLRKGRFYDILGKVLGCIIAFGGIAFSTYADMVLDSFPLMILGIVITVLGGVVSVIICDWTDPGIELEGSVTEKIVPEIIKEVFGDVDHDAYGHIDEDLIRTIDMGFPEERLDKVTGNDLVKGNYKGMDFEFSDIKMTYEDLFRKPAYRTVTTFRGTWLILNSGRKLSSDVIVSEKKKWDQKAPDDFSRRFAVKAGNSLAETELLTPDMKQTILSVREKSRGPMYYHFTSDGKIYIAMDSGIDRFELYYSAGQSLQNLKKEFREDAEALRNVLDAFQKTS